MGTPETEAYSNPWGQTTLLPTDISTARLAKNWISTFLEMMYEWGGGRY